MQEMRMKVSSSGVGDIAVCWNGLLDARMIYPLFSDMHAISIELILPNASSNQCEISDNGHCSLTLSVAIAG